MSISRRINPGSKFWFYLTIMLIYFLLIGIVITVLLLAPKYTSSSSSLVSTKKNWVRNELKEVDQRPLNPPNLPFFDFDHSLGEDGIPILHSSYDRGQKPTLIPSRRDPIFDIDPRSSVPQKGQNSGQMETENKKNESQAGNINSNSNNNTNQTFTVDSDSEIPDSIYIKPS